LAAKKFKHSEIRCLTNPHINECACENLRGEFVAARSELQFVSKKPTTRIAIMLRNPSKATLKPLSTECELFAKFIQISYANDEWVLSDPGPDELSDEIPLGSLQLSITEVECALMDLEANKGPGPDKIPPSILKKCATGFATPLSLIFNR
jgi:hypothetical protein